MSIFEKSTVRMNKRLVLNRIKKAIREKDPSADVYLFGSRVRGDNRSDSDWDILILVDSTKVTNEIEDKFRDELYDIELNTGQIISIFIYPKDLWETSLRFSPLYRNVKKEGILL